MGRIRSSDEDLLHEERRQLSVGLRRPVSPAPAEQLCKSAEDHCWDQPPSAMVYSLPEMCYYEEPSQ